MKKFKLSDYPGRVVMHVTTEQEAHTFLKFLATAGRRWMTGFSYLEETFFDKFESETCYDFNQGCYSSRKFFQDNEYTILEFSDFDWTGQLEKEAKKTLWVIEYKEYALGPTMFDSVYASSAQEAVDHARFDWNVYSVEACYKKVKNWS